MSAKLAWLTPDTVTPTGYICRRILIPDDIGYVSAVNGALLELAKAYNWEKFGVATPEQAASLMWEMWLSWHGSDCMIGSVIAYATATPPSNTLPCDGAQYLRVDYPVLYSLLDPVFIIDVDNFITPDLRGRTVISTGQGSGLSQRNIGDTGGEETHQLTVQELASHAHTDSGHTHSEVTATISIPAEPCVTPPACVATSIPGVGVTGVGNANITNTGNDTAHNNMQPFFALNYCIVAR